MIKTFIYLTALFFDKSIATCSPGCNEQFIGDYVCDIECNYSYCDFDGGDCLDMNYLYDSNDTNVINDTNNTNVINEFYYTFDSNTGSCNLTNCPNLFFDDCNILQKYTNKWCDFDDDDHNYDICCAKYHTDCCEYDNVAVFLASCSFFLIIVCSCYGVFKKFSDCCDD